MIDSGFNSLIGDEYTISKEIIKDIAIAEKHKVNEDRI
jgi:hypothetical protein